MAYDKLPQVGRRIQNARKRRYPKDDLAAFAARCEISRATLHKMEQGDLSISMSRYYAVAKRLGLTEGFHRLFEEEESLFDDE